MYDAYVLLTEQDAIWSEILPDILKQDGISCIAVPVRGAGLTLSTGMQERFEFFVPESNFEEARKLLQKFFQK